MLRQLGPRLLLILQPSSRIFILAVDYLVHPVLLLPLAVREENFRSRVLQNLGLAGRPSDGMAEYLFVNDMQRLPWHDALLLDNMRRTRHLGSRRAAVQQTALELCDFFMTCDAVELLWYPAQTEVYLNGDIQEYVYESEDVVMFFQHQGVSGAFHITFPEAV